MKHGVYRILFAAVGGVMSVCYTLLKYFTKEKPNKVLFLSRQQDTPSLDFTMLRGRLLLERKDTRIVVITKRLEGGFRNTLAFVPVLLRSMYHLATARVCVLDTYWPAVSLLSHRSSLLVIQMWHAMGKIKRSGYQTLDLPYGRRSETAALLRMHRGYDFVIAGGEAMDRSYCESFGVDRQLLLHYGLPRMDDLLMNHRTYAEAFRREHPQTKNRKMILYVPTFRKHAFSGFEEMIQAFADDDFLLVIRPHSVQKLTNPARLEPYLYPDTPLNTLLSACDYVITDYSAVLFEAAVIRQKTYMFLPDHESYITCNGLNIDPMECLHEIAFTAADKICAQIRTCAYDNEPLERFAAEYLPQPIGKATEQIAAVVLDCLDHGKAYVLERYKDSSEVSA